ncbi:ABC transporter substrate-binding protein [Arthrobacter halodurans]|jgi:NitT/TauT family transport system substrate-binding protein|uniref:ABC transporter substrate-binding protein n=1 Tax=Arthrobacter halodurans TaxID=516699 RepID=A0ABV4UL27_9MICC
MNQRILYAAGVAALLALTSCAAPAATPASGPDTEAPTTVNVAETTGVPSAFLQYGVDQGFFADRGLTVNVDVSAGGAAAVPALVSGNIQFAGSNAVSVLIASSKGLPLKVIAPGTRTAESAELDFSKVLVAGDSDIEDVADLAGRKVAVNTLANISEVSLRAALGNLGADASSIEFVELGLPDMLPALEQGHVDAALSIEPFVTMGVEDGARAVLSPYAQSMPGLMVGAYITTEDYLNGNPEVVAAFRQGLEDTSASIASDPDAFRAALPEYAKVSEAAATSMNLPEWKPGVSRESLEFLNEKSVEYGLFDEAVDIDALVAE